ncbi:MAG: nitrogen regulatory protein PII [Saprospiraceae bacterium]|jgi:nitrogen regulatory protein PII
MKLIIAYFRQEQLPAIKESLADSEFFHFTAMPVLGTAPKAEQRTFRGVEQKVSFFKRVRLEIALKEAQVEPAIEALSRGAMDSGGAGRIYVTELHDAVKIWTGERGERAL